MLYESWPEVCLKKRDVIMIINGKNYIKLLGIINILYVLIRVLADIESYSALDITNSLVTIFINLIFGLGLIYAIYKNKNKARLFLSGISVLGLIACANIYMNGKFGITQILTSIYGVSCLVILSRDEVIDYMRSSGKSV